jgi:hypothetical protein
MLPMRKICFLAAVLALGLAGRAAMRAGEPGKIDVKATKDHIDFLAGGELVGRYRIGADVARPYFWPLNAPGGVPVTRGWPMEKAGPGESTDHPHQKSAWFCHGDVIPEGLELEDKIPGVKGVDFWSEAKGHGRIVCTEVGTPAFGKGEARVATKNEWRTAGGKKILDETRIIRLYDLGKARLLVFDIDLLASVCPITFGDTKEGSMGVRVNDKIRTEVVVKKKRVAGPGRIENAEGKVGERDKTGPICWGQLSAWCDYSGPIDGKTVGVAIFDDPKNPHPACWHVRGYGLMAANPFGRDRSFPAMKGKKELVRLAKGEHLRLRYGVLLHTGDAATGQVADAYRRFVELRARE